jgi:N-acetylmuramic acid 6-phosphate etherase
MQNTYLSPEEKALDFIENEKEFHLGFLPTEQSHPKTVGLDKAVERNVSDGVKLLQKVDRDIISVAEKVFPSKEFQDLVDSICQSVVTGKKVVFSGCGATGRLSILLEGMWRKFWQDFKKENPSIQDYENSVFSIMTGGDYALVKSVESFEDYSQFGRRQAMDMGIDKGDTFVAITEGGETSSVIGTALQAIEDGAKVFIAFNNPSHLLSEKIDRSNSIIEHPESIVLDLHSGPMAIAGSTRMQAVTSELLVVGAALEKALFRIAETSNFELPFQDFGNPAESYLKLLNDLESEKSVEAISKIIDLEEGIYSNEGLITYFADNALLDIFTDTTERAPTFMLPPFVKCDDKKSPQSWAFVKSPLCLTKEAWYKVYGRKPRCLEWTKEDYISLESPKKFIDNPPKLNAEELMKFKVGYEPATERYSADNSAAIALLAPSDLNGNKAKFMKQFNVLKNNYSQSQIIAIGTEIPEATYYLPCEIRKTPLMLWERLAVKLLMNTVSTLTMVKMGRIKSNWMSWVEATNKKLIDRGTRLISELCEIPYSDACRELFVSIEEIENTDWGNKPKPSPVQITINRIT